MPVDSANMCFSDVNQRIYVNVLKLIVHTSILENYDTLLG